AARVRADHVAHGGYRADTVPVEVAGPPDQVRGDEEVAAPRAARQLLAHGERTRAAVVEGDHPVAVAQLVHRPRRAPRGAPGLVELLPEGIRGDRVDVTAALDHVVVHEGPELHRPMRRRARNQPTAWPEPCPRWKAG